jgi:hypothetical protein
MIVPPTKSKKLNNGEIVVNLMTNDGVNDELFESLSKSELMK